MASVRFLFCTQDMHQEHAAALTIGDDRLGTVFCGQASRGTHESRGVMMKLLQINVTPGKALGTAGGGFSTGRKGLLALLRQGPRPCLFSNTVAASIVPACLL